jgi:hypothetical protein
MESIKIWSAQGMSAPKLYIEVLSRYGAIENLGKKNHGHEIT